MNPRNNQPNPPHPPDQAKSDPPHPPDQAKSDPPHPPDQAQSGQPDQRAALFNHARRIASNRDAGASALLAELLPLLADAVGNHRHSLSDIARIVCRGQPAMAPLWNACAAALADIDRPGRFASTRAQMERAPRALQRAAAAALIDALAGESAPRLLTLSYSKSVGDALRMLHATAGRSLHVICGESRPRFEGRRLAQELAETGVRVTLVTDAAVPSFLDQSAVVVVGADAVGRTHWINKVGTRGLAAAALTTGRPVFVVASRDKFVAPELETLLQLPEGPPEEVWLSPSSNLFVSNPYFEPTPVEYSTLFLTESGPIPSADIASAIAAQTVDADALGHALAG